MKKITLILAATVAGTLALNAQLDITNLVSFKAVGKVQQDEVTVTNGTTVTTTETTTNLTLTTKTLLTMIATDQGFTLPVGAKLGVVEDQFVILNADNSFFTNVNSTVVSNTIVESVEKSKDVENPAGETFSQTSSLVGVLVYDGLSIEFVLNYYGQANTSAKFVEATSKVTESFSFSASGAGHGGIDGQDMVIQGSMSAKGKHAFVVP